jgi:hypothetical protein
MLIPLFAVVAAAVAQASAANAPVVSVTVFNDRARVVREAKLNLHGSEQFTLALLPDSVEPSSIRLELVDAPHAAAVQKVYLVHLDTDAFPEDDARKLLEQLDEADDRINLVYRERALVRAQQIQLQGVRPVAPQPDLRGPAPKLNPSGWTTSLQFFLMSAERLQARVRELDAKAGQLERARQKLAQEARLLGASHRRTGTQVTARITGEGPVRARLIYMVGGARWRPRWELTYRPASGKNPETVQANLSGLVTQATGEEWTQALLSLSTAIPGTQTSLPELLSWRIGQKERFQPVSHSDTSPQPIPRLPWPQLSSDDVLSPQARKDRLRERLLTRAQGEQRDLSLEPDSAETAIGDSEGGAVGGVLGGVAAGSYGTTLNGSGAAESNHARGGTQAQRVLPSPPPPAPAAPPPNRKTRPVKSTASTDTGGTVSKEQMALVPYGRNARSLDAVVTSNAPPASAPRSSSNDMEFDAAEVSTQSMRSRPAQPIEQIGISPPPAWQAPSFDEDAPANLSGGFDLLFDAKNPSTLESGESAHSVPLFSESWPVRTERLLFPAIAQEAWLVAKLTVPAERTLPGGYAELFVGADPAGNARLHAMAPNEEIELPLGIDRSIKPTRNVTQLQSEQGLISKADVDDYAVSIELTNPYPRAVALRVFDQLPLKGSEDLEVEFVSASPAIKPNKDTGELEWAFELAAAQKTKLEFHYRLKRPHGARLHQ